MRVEEKEMYDQALDEYCRIVRHGGNTIDEVRNCLKKMEYFEDYEKCKDLSEIIRAHEITSPSPTKRYQDANREKAQ